MMLCYPKFSIFPSVLTILFISNCYCPDSPFKFRLQFDRFTYVTLLNETIKNPWDNTLFSPLSILISHTLIMAGARDKTWKSLAHSLRLSYGERANSTKFTEGFGRVIIFAQNFK